MNREDILRKVSKNEDRILLSKVLDKVFKCEKSGEVLNTEFLDPYQRGIVARMISDITLYNKNSIKFKFNGGYEGAERVLLIFSPEFLFYDNEHSKVNSINQYFKLLNIKVNDPVGLSHRDFLGSLMGLGIKREKIGDILLREDNSKTIHCQIIVLKEVADYISYNLEKIGKTRASVTLEDVSDLKCAEQSVKTVAASVASLRLDSIVSAGFNLSRDKAAEAIKSERVSINWEIINSLTKQIKEGDTISFKGKGRIVVEKINGLTKKGRTSILINKLL